MSERKLVLLAVFAAGAAIPGIPALAFLWSVGAAQPLFAGVGLVAAACGIAAVVRLVNCHGDSRHARRPPDGP
jgi:hypothetical protein